MFLKQESSLEFVWLCNGYGKLKTNDLKDYIYF